MDITNKCVHNFASGETTLVELPYMLLVFPPIKFFQCSHCGEIFQYIMIEDGTYQPMSEVKEVKEDANFSGNA